MRRFLAALRCDVIVQFRSGFYYVGAFVAIFFIGLLSLVPEGVLNLQLVVPAALLTNLVVTTFGFIAGLVLLERGEGTLAAMLTSPLRDTEYLAAKIASLAILAVGENLVIVMLAFGTDFDPVPLLAGMILLSAFYTLAGFLMISRYDSINEYLMPSGAAVTLLMLPLLDHFGIVKSVVFYLHPAQPALVLMRSAYGAVAPWEVAYGAAASFAWIVVGFVWAQRIFHRFALRAVGT